MPFYTCMLNRINQNENKLYRACMNMIKVWNAPKNFIWIQIYCSELKLVRCDGFYGRGRGFTRSQGAPRSHLHFGWLYFVHICMFFYYFLLGQFFLQSEEEDVWALRALHAAACILDGFISVIFLILFLFFCNFKLWRGLTHYQPAFWMTLFSCIFFKYILYDFFWTACSFTQDGSESFPDVIAFSLISTLHHIVANLFFTSVQNPLILLFIGTFQIMSGVKNLKGAKKRDLRALQAIWNAPVWG